ncbi:Aste57867_12817 [Aphanomyces stellatus]|uniref:Aste57867_12817 protein n=1 Tax=Aphanomyces stellatus TaxID=120398 RepID=A0A485KWJ5_9STRA|nr:hypothetical protein As57867_012769 [Aphanomyces stellatus]VFT89664.1 Aste57867_12817 [Aphanomyces stellatus]
MTDTLTALKIGFRGEIHRIRVDLSSFDLPNLQALFETTFNLCPDSFVVQYKDEQSNFVNVHSTDEFQTACCILLTQATAGEHDVGKSLRFFAVPTTEATFHANVSTSIRRALDSFNDALQPQQLSATLSHTGAVLNDTLHQTGTTLGHVYQKTVEESKVAFDHAKKSWHDIEFERALHETAENIKVAAAGVSMYTQELVQNIQKMTMPPTAAPLATDVPSAAPSTVPAVSSLPVAPLPPLAPTPPPVVVVIPPTKWAAELALVREIMPDADTTIVVALLETSKGDVQVVMDALTSS